MGRNGEIHCHHPKVLTDFSLRIPPGRMVALVGESGGGKSTVAALLERFYDCQEGSVCVDGINVKQLDPRWLRGKAIGYIDQEPVLFATSVMENIRYGRPDAGDEEVSSFPVFILRLISMSLESARDVSDVRHRSFAGVRSSKGCQCS